MPPDESNPWQTLSKKVSFENPWFSVSERDVITPAGEPGYYGLIHFKRHAVGAIPIDEEGNTWLVGQYRYAHDTYEWEIPEGGADPGETTLECAKRELLEETGIVAESWEMLLEMQVSNSVTDELIRAHSAKGGFKAHLHPLKANHLDHALLFNTTHKHLEPASSPARPVGSR